MTAASALRVLVLAPSCDGTDVGEAANAHQWVASLSQRAQVTVLTTRKRGRRPSAQQLRDVEVIEWDNIPLLERFERFESMLKPGYIPYYARARRWIRDALAAGRRFDVIHQFTPIALRYPSPGAGFGLPLVIGPQAGSLETPEAFRRECGQAPWYTRLRRLDAVRLRRDPWLRRTYACAAAVIGVAPYVRDLLHSIPVKRFELMSEIGVHHLEPETARRRRGGELRLVHVGRAVRTKGLRDAVRALAACRELSGVTLEAAGVGEDLAACRREADSLGVRDRIRFHGRLPRERIEDLYRRADAFLFPSFREPSGTVVFEALRHGLPVITTAHGGPGFVVDETCGIKVPANSPAQLSAGLAEAVTRLANDQRLHERLRAGARRRVETIGLWSSKIEWLCRLYGELQPSPVHRGHSNA